jgi:integrase
VIVDIGHDANGKRQQRWHSVKGTRRDAENKLIQLLRSLQTGEYVEPSKLTVKALLERWLADAAQPTTSGKTYERYAEIVNAHLVPALGHHVLSRLQPLHIQALYSEALKSGRRDGKGGLSSRSVLHLHRVLHRALKQAVRWQLLARNPADAVDPPRPQPREVQVIDEIQTGQLLREVANSRLYMPVLLAATTGMRRGELLALTWADVDLKSETVTVTKSLEQTKQGLLVKAPKTAKGRRRIPLPALAAVALRKHKADQAKRRLLLGAAYEDHDLVCAAPNGVHWQPDSLSKEFQVLQTRAGLRRIRFHDLRHSHATHLLRQSVHPKIVSERLGHSSIAITLDTYSHVVPGLQEEAAKQLDRTLRMAIRKADAG